MMAGCPGVDVSAWQRWGDAEWAAVAAAGYRYAFVKAVEGVSRDRRFAEHWGNAREAGLIRGAYAFFHTTMAPRAQADAFLEVLADHGAGEMPCVIDIETAHGMTPEAITDAVCEWVDIVHQATEVRPIVYTYGSFSTHHMVGERLAECPLWVAHYGVNAPAHSKAWKRWDFWQHTGKGQIPGITGNVDLNVYAGTFAELCTAYGVIA